MANTTFPMLSENNWWQLRQKFVQSIPSVINGIMLSSLLDMQERSAKQNIIPYLRQVGIIDSDGKPTERATLWRDDEDYPKVCEAMRKEIYPPELQDLILNNGDDDDKEAVRRWFSRQTGAGASAISKMVSFYMILVAADPTKSSLTAKKSSSTKQSTKPSVTSTKKVTEMKKVQPVYRETSKGKSIEHEEKSLCNLNTPSMNINLQIHISADATVEQIDKIFESMAKHIYNRR